MINHKPAIKKHKKYNPFDENHMPSFKVMQDNLISRTLRQGWNISIRHQQIKEHHKIMLDKIISKPLKNQTVSKRNFIYFIQTKRKRISLS